MSSENDEKLIKTLKLLEKSCDFLNNPNIKNKENILDKLEELQGTIQNFLKTNETNLSSTSKDETHVSNYKSQILKAKDIAKKSTSLIATTINDLGLSESEVAFLLFNGDNVICRLCNAKLLHQVSEIKIHLKGKTHQKKLMSKYTEYIPNKEKGYFSLVDFKLFCKKCNIYILKPSLVDIHIKNSNHLDEKIKEENKSKKVEINCIEIQKPSNSISEKNSTLPDGFMNYENSLICIKCVKIVPNNPTNISQHIFGNIHIKKENAYSEKGVNFNSLYEAVTNIDIDKITSKFKKNEKTDLVLNEDNSFNKKNYFDWHLEKYFQFSPNGSKLQCTVCNRFLSVNGKNVKEHILGHNHRKNTKENGILTYLINSILDNRLTFNDIDLFSIQEFSSIQMICILCTNTLPKNANNIEEHLNGNDHKKIKCKIITDLNKISLESKNK